MNCLAPLPPMTVSFGTPPIVSLSEPPRIVSPAPLHTVMLPCVPSTIDFARFIAATNMLPPLPPKIVSPATPPIVSLPAVAAADRVCRRAPDRLVAAAAAEHGLVALRRIEEL